MEFFLTLTVMAALAGALSAVIVSGWFRSRRPYAKLTAVALGVFLFLIFSVGGVILLIIESGRRGHPF